MEIHMVNHMVIQMIFFMILTDKKMWFCKKKSEKDNVSFTDCIRNFTYIENVLIINQILYNSDVKE